MRAFLFDLDDTLYPEQQFVRGGLRAVARRLAARFDREADAVERELVEILARDGRGKVFDTFLARRGIAAAGLVPALVRAYREHTPELSLDPEALPLLARLRALGLRLGLVTDGLAAVQRRKIAALGLDAWFEAIVCTDELGPDQAKPSPRPFLAALARLGVAPQEAYHVGNDPTRDVAGAQAAGLRAVLIASDASCPRAVTPDLVVRRLSELSGLAGGGA
jgi:putative hydrolase of the HAD superfamily